MIIIEQFKTNLIEDGKSTNTVQSYVGDITAFLKYLGTMGVEFDGVLKRFYITSYKNYLVDNNVYGKSIELDKLKLPNENYVS